MNPDNKLVLKRTILIKADVDHVWDALINPDLTERYVFGLRVSSDWKIGSPVVWKGRFQGKDLMHRGRVLNFEPRRILQITDFDALGVADDVPSNYTTVTYELSSENAGSVTRLNITEENFGGDQRKFDDSCRFWDSTLPKLKAMMEA